LTGLGPMSKCPAQTSRLDTVHLTLEEDCSVAQITQVGFESLRNDGPSLLVGLRLTKGVKVTSGKIEAQGFNRARFRGGDWG
jgi:hypothetical protein